MLRISEQLDRSEEGLERLPRRQRRISACGTEWRTGAEPSDTPLTISLISNHSIKADLKKNPKKQCHLRETFELVSGTGIYIYIFVQVCYQLQQWQKYDLFMFLDFLKPALAFPGRSKLSLSRYPSCTLVSGHHIAARPLRVLHTLKPP